MKVLVQRIFDNDDATLGVMYINGEAECFTMEDQFQTKKVYGETRIPEGEYEIKLRTVGGKNERYKANYPNIHKGMLWLQDVPGFQYILIHVGNDDDDSEGCILVGATVPYDVKSVLYTGSSVIAYKRIYNKISQALIDGEKVTISII